jgi:hypothetical protein
LVSFFATRTPLGIWLRNVVMWTMTFYPLADPVLTRGLRDDLELPEYPM